MRPRPTSRTSAPRPCLPADLGDHFVDAEPGGRWPCGRARLSPVIIATLRPSACSAAIASGVVSLIGSATAMMAASGRRSRRRAGSCPRRPAARLLSAKHATSRPSSRIQRSAPISTTIDRRPAMTPKPGLGVVAVDPVRASEDSRCARGLDDGFGDRMLRRASTAAIQRQHLARSKPSGRPGRSARAGLRSACRSCPAR
jgi:hypothetical protein